MKSLRLFESDIVEVFPHLALLVFRHSISMEYQLKMVKPVGPVFDFIYKMNMFTKR